MAREKSDIRRFERMPKLYSNELGKGSKRLPVEPYVAMELVGVLSKDINR